MLPFAVVDEVDRRADAAEPTVIGLPDLSTRQLHAIRCNRRSARCGRMCGMPFSLPIPAEANALLDRDPLALLIGMTLDQQIPLEKAFTSP